MKNESAFPQIDHNQDFADSDGSYLHISLSGSLTKRELFAAMAMHGMISNPEMIATALSVGAKANMEAKNVVAKGAVSYAAALITELEKET